MSEEIKKIFSAHDMKNTRQRQMVYHFLMHSAHPVTAEEIYVGLAAQGDDSMNLSTVYRILDAFTKKGMTVKSNLTLEGSSTYEINPMEHRHYLICVKCNTVIPIKGCPLKAYEKELGETTHFKILEHRLEILGICPKCQKSEKQK
jgi:Fur family ferric uptake transcriptional regulator